MDKYFANSNFKTDTYYKKENFKQMINVARKAGKEALYNTIRLLNNCLYARQLKGYVSLSDIFKALLETF